MGLPSSILSSLRYNENQRRKSNVNLKRDKFLTFAGGKNRYNFKTPTPEEIAKSNQSNQLFIAQQKRKARIALVFSLVTSILMISYLFGILSAIKKAFYVMVCF